MTASECREILERIACRDSTTNAEVQALIFASAAVGALADQFGVSPDKLKRDEKEMYDPALTAGSLGVSEV